MYLGSVSFSGVEDSCEWLDFESLLYRSIWVENSISALEFHRFSRSVGDDWSDGAADVENRFFYRGEVHE